MISIFRFTLHMFFKYSTYTKIKNILRTFETDNHKILRTSQPKKLFTGPYKKKECIRRIVSYDDIGC